jgi:hypothetical protein
MSRLVLLLVTLLFLASPLSISARNAKLFKPGKYWQASKDEYAKGETTNAQINATQPQQILTSLSGTLGTIVRLQQHTHRGVKMRWTGPPCNLLSFLYASFRLLAPLLLF